MKGAKLLIVTVANSSKSSLFAQAEIKKNVLHRVRYLSSSVSAQSFPAGTSSQYVEDMYNAWLKNPASVHEVSLITYNFILHRLVFLRSNLCFLVMGFLFPK